MDARTWAAAKDVLAAVAHLSPAEQRAYVEQHCTNPALQAELLTLLDSPAALSDVVARAVTLASGIRIGVYEVVASIGVGGMGEVYRARDTKLNRDVALKVLPASVAADRDLLDRFAHEARVLASLNHPNIGTIHGWEESTGVRAIVLELVEGPTLRELIAAGSLSVDSALAIAHQIADALEAAHEQGIVHRDLKPANVKVRADGRVKVLDFGLAKVLASDGTPRAADAPTQAATRTGFVVGTPAYMSPEQARGEPVSRRTDVWAFGIVLFEMLTGRHPFGGGRATEVVAGILHATPDWGALPAATPLPIAHLLRRCLEKDPQSRLRDIGDARLEIDDARSGASATAPGGVPAAHGPAAGGWSRRAQVAAAIIAVGVAGAAIAAAYLLGDRRSTAPATETRLAIVPPLDTHFASTPAVSPDGRMVAFVAQTEDQPPHLWVKSLAAFAPALLAGTDGATYPFWSPDSKAIGFFADGKLKRINAKDDDRPIAVCDAPSGRGGTWLDDGTIVFAPDPRAALARVPAAGGAVTPLTTLDTAHGEQGHRFPSWIPGGYLLYYTWNRTITDSGVRLVSLNDPTRSIAFHSNIAAAEYANGFLLFSREGRLLSQRMRLPGGELSGDISQIGMVRSAESLGRSVWSSTPAGVIALVSPTNPIGQFAWMSRDGRLVATLGEPDAHRGVELSPNGQQLATRRAPSGGLEVIDTTQAIVRSVFKLASEHPVWSPDGTQLAFLNQGAAPEPGLFNLLSAPLDRGKIESLRTDPQSLMKPVGWTPGGRTFVWVQTDGATFGIWTMPSGHPDRAAPYLQDSTRNVEGRLSRDGQWIAFASDRTGAFEIVVQHFPEPGSRFTVSSHGGRFPHWRGDGHELYYLSPDSKIMAVSVTPGDPPVFGMPQALFDVKLVTQPDPIIYANYEYDVASDGSRFIIDRQISVPVSTMDVIVNWHR